MELQNEHLIEALNSLSGLPLEPGTVRAGRRSLRGIPLETHRGMRQGIQIALSRAQHQIFEMRDHLIEVLAANRPVIRDNLPGSFERGVLKEVIIKPIPDSEQERQQEGWVSIGLNGRGEIVRITIESDISSSSGGLAEEESEVKPPLQGVMKWEREEEGSILVVKELVLLRNTTPRPYTSVRLGEQKIEVTSGWGELQVFRGYLEQSQEAVEKASQAAK